MEETALSKQSQRDPPALNSERPHGLREIKPKWERFSREDVKKLVETVMSDSWSFPDSST